MTYIHFSPVLQQCEPPVSAEPSYLQVLPSPTTCIPKFPTYPHTLLPIVTLPTMPPIHTPLCRVSYDVITVEYPNRPTQVLLVQTPDRPTLCRKSRRLVERVFLRGGTGIRTHCIRS
ncbi:hypothetical protein K440DRAFT_226122 [Wilcoxina mikolae CBS 423.85]|nr:hypothetical protein K440DRAFT_226122 [Wilcoxina mikolae CBS 423.85]